MRGFATVKANQLSAQMRLLHHIVSRILLPKTGLFDYITKQELIIMVCLIRGREINLPAILFHQIREASERKRACLPYGMALTLIFREYEVSLEREAYLCILHSDVYDDRSLHRRTDEGARSKR